jgi:hypothetical protein
MTRHESPEDGVSSKLFHSLSSASNSLIIKHVEKEGITQDIQKHESRQDAM